MSNSSCSLGDNQLEKCKDWYKPSLATTDYYNACQTDINKGCGVPKNWLGHQNAYDGFGYIGLILLDTLSPSLTEYVQCKLVEPLIACKKYLVNFRASLADYSLAYTPTLGLRLDKTAIKKVSPFEIVGFELPPHISSNVYIDTASWYTISGIYEADGGEEFLTIGRFIDTNMYNNNNLPYNHLVPLDCDTCYNFGAPCQFYIDMVEVYESVEVKSDVIEFPNVLTVNSDGVNDIWKPLSDCLSIWNCEIFNRWGQLVFAFSNNEYWEGNDQLGNKLNNGIYYYKLTNNKNHIKTGYIHLIRD